MVGVYSVVAGLILVVLGFLGFLGPLGWDPAASAFHLSVGLLYLLAVPLLKEASYVRAVVGGLGVLLVATKAVTIVASALLGDEPLHGPIEVTCLVLGITSILAARFLPNAG